MIRLAPPDARCLVFTKRHGVLAAVGHDLVLSVARFEIRWDASARALEAEAELGSLELVGAGEGGSGPISARDAADILDNAQRKVLAVSRHPIARFSARDVDLSAPRVAGDLTLRGVTRGVEMKLERAESRLAVTFVVHQPDFGIEPFSAMLGALKVAADVIVRVETPLL